MYNSPTVEEVNAACGSVTRKLMWKHLLLLATIVAGALLLRAVLSPQFDGLDDIGYLEAATMLARGEDYPSHTSLFYLRTGMSYPLGFLLRLGVFEPKDFWLLTLAAEGATLAALFVTGVRLISPVGGLLAAALYSIYPLAVWQATMFMPTAFQIASIAVAICLFSHSDNSSSIRSLAPAFFAGVALGLGYLAKEDVALLVPAMAVSAVVIGYRRWPTAAALCAGAAFVFGAECVHYYYADGNALHRFFPVGGPERPLVDPHFNESLSISALMKWHGFLRPLLVMPYQVGLYWWFGLLALVWAVLWGNRQTRFLAVVLLLVGLYLQFGSASFREYSPLPKGPRYTAILTPALLLLISAWTVHLHQRGYRRWSVLAPGVLAASGLACIVLCSLCANERTRNTLAALRAMNAQRIDTVYTDYYSARLLRVLTLGKLDAKVWIHADLSKSERIDVRVPPLELVDTHVLLDRQCLKVYTSSYGLPLPKELAELPSAWELLWTHRAYRQGSWERCFLVALRAVAEVLPENSISRRIRRNVTDMIEDDEAYLYYVPPIINKEPATG